MSGNGNTGGPNGANGSADEPIRVLIAEEDDQVRDDMRAHLSVQAGIEVIAAVLDGERALRLAGQLQPDVAILSATTPRLDGISVAESISTAVPCCQTILTSAHHDVDTMRRAMLVGVREFLVKPLNAEDLSRAVRRVYDQEARKRSAYHANGDSQGSASSAPSRQRAGAIVTFWGPKGGVGRTFLATNTALSIAQAKGRRVLLVDGSLEFGNIDVLLDIEMKKGMVDLLVDREEDLDPDLIDRVVAHYAGNVDVLLTPPTQALAMITAMHIQRILAVTRRLYDYVIIDARASLDDATLAFLDLSDIILAISTPELTALRNLRVFLDTSVRLGYSADKVRVIINRYDMKSAIPVPEIEKACRRTVAMSIGNDHEAASGSINQGRPVVISLPQRPISRDIVKLAAMVAPSGETEQKVAPKQRMLDMSKLFARQVAR